MDILTTESSAREKPALSPSKWVGSMTKRLSGLYGLSTATEGMQVVEL
jgi:hypothetical protein